MKRRHFVQWLLGWGMALGEFFSFPRKLFSRILPQNQLPRGHNQITLTHPRTGVKTRLRVDWHYSVAYISAHQFARALGYHIYFNEQKSKMVLYLPGNKVLVTANNPFILIDNKTFQLPVPAIWKEQQIWVPLEPFLAVLNRNTNLNIAFDAGDQQVRIQEKHYNVTGIEISTRANGTVIRIRTSKKYRKEEMTASMRYGWLHVDLYGARADVALLKQTPVKGLVRQVKAFQFKDLLSIAFLLREEPLSRELYQDEFSGDIVVVLRTREEIPDPAEEPTTGTGNDAATDAVDPVDLEKEREKWLIDRVVIDPGHGGKDPGAIGVGNLKEKDVVLDIALRLGRLIEKKMPGVEVIYTRKDDRFVELKERTRIANRKKGKVFISIHANWSPNKRTSGFETYIVGPEKGERAAEVVLKENSVIEFEDNKEEYEGINFILAQMAQSAFMRHSEYLASLVQEEMEKRLRSLKMKSRGVKQGPFWVMVGATMPSILVETGFVSNPYEARLLRTKRHRQKIAEGIFAGLQRFKKDYESSI
ncbi:MAG: hypothetical protein GXO78_06120 [Calditrichaeota bacterium]|nr:hypothetical protein [Calditrichota bacterium]